MSLYMIFAFDSKSKADAFIITTNIELSEERKLVPIDWTEVSMDDVEDFLRKNLFDGNYNYFVLCEIEFEGIRLIEIENKQECAS